MNEEKYQGNDIQGWMSPAELQFLFENAKEAKSVLEIGSWKGRSSHAILSGCKGMVTCVDHFKGSEGEGSAHAEANSDDEPVYKDFMKNVGEFSNLRVIKASSKEAKDILKDEKFDMIFIDGGHRYEDVVDDMKLWKDNATVLLCGHDYNPICWPAVINAVITVLGGLPTGVVDTIWYQEVKK